MFNVVKRLNSSLKYNWIFNIKINIENTLKKSTTCVQISDPLYCYVLKNHAKVNIKYLKV